MIKQMEINLARLDGYLTGIVALNGQINDYYAGAFLLNDVDEKTIESALTIYFAPNCQINFINKRTEISLRKLESEIQGFIADNLFGVNEDVIDAAILYDRKKYIAFKIMDMIDFVIFENESASKPSVHEHVHKIEVEFEDSSSNFTFFCISFCNHVLVLQFMKPSA